MPCQTCVVSPGSNNSSRSHFAAPLDSGVRRMSKASPIVVFDFDLTLTRWDTADRFFRWLLKREPWRSGLVLITAPVLGPLFLFKATRKWPIRFAVWAATLGRSARDLAFLAQDHV